MVISTIIVKNVAPQKVYRVFEASKTDFLSSYSTVSDKMRSTLKDKGMRTNGWNWDCTLNSTPVVSLNMDSRIEPLKLLSHEDIHALWGTKM